MPRALHAQIRADLEARIRSGEWPPGTRLPTEAELQRAHGVSRVTVQRALRDLVNAGMVRRFRRRGTFVAPGAGEENLLRSVNLLAEGEDHRGPHRVVDARVIAARDADVELAEIDKDSPIIRLERVKLDKQDRPVATETHYVPFHVAPHLLDEPLEDLVTLTYYRRNDIPIARARMYVDPIALTPELAALFDRQPGAAVFRFRRVLWLDSGALAEMASFVLAEDTHFYVEQTYPPRRGDNR
ncbi:MAG: GntR family transcriptional regulator [Pseudonocardiaceae bacterium]|nr:GntR family transcriptional regulator [Pseudonocardiaceae bacterium]